MVTPISIRYAQEEDYKKRNNFNVSTLHHASTLQKTKESRGAEQNTPLDLQNLPFDPAIEAMKESRLVSNKKAQ